MTPSTREIHRAYSSAHQKPKSYIDLVVLVGGCESVEKLLSSKFSLLSFPEPLWKIQVGRSPAFGKIWWKPNLTTFPQNVLCGLCKNWWQSYFCNDSESSVISLCSVSSLPTSDSIFSTE